LSIRQLFATIALFSNRSRRSLYPVATLHARDDTDRRLAPDPVAHR